MGLCVMQGLHCVRPRGLCPSCQARVSEAPWAPADWTPRKETGTEATVSLSVSAVLTHLRCPPAMSDLFKGPWEG